MQHDTPIGSTFPTSVGSLVDSIGSIPTGNSASNDGRDPWTDRFVARRVGDRVAAKVAEQTQGQLSGVAVLVPADSRRGPALADRLARWNPERLRVEQITLEQPVEDDTHRARAVALENAVLAAASDFVVVPTDHTAQMDRLPELLVNMWVEGADIGLMGPTGEQPAVRATDPVARRRALWDSPGAAGSLRSDRISDPIPSAELEGTDTAARVAAWLGLSEAPVSGRIVVVRRWVARWLLSDIGQASDAVEEFADRARVLGLAVVELNDRNTEN